MPPYQVFLFKFYHQGSGRRDEWLLLESERRHARSPLHGRIFFFRRTRTNRRAWGSQGLWSMTTSGQILLTDFACASDAGIRRWDLCFRPAGCIQQELPDMLGGTRTYYYPVYTDVGHIRVLFFIGTYMIVLPPPALQNRLAVDEEEEDMDPEEWHFL
ncbi:unnamed protein product [Symbiodinium natans]|uniref:Uncharacterized protein n=1 Tax=Symbiodinium natans TaxID=878477 RepID=A0A812JTQ2_9DINO|nr:unnamed protein product [Symbiodinium natans]CAE7213644.1 unnamed protein product [Symbiodinium natans]